MKYSIEIGKIVEGALKHDRVKVRNYTEKLIQQLESNGETIPANKFKRLLATTDESTLKAMGGNDITKIPVDSESRAMLADIILPSENNIKVVLSKRNEEQMNDFVCSYKNADELNNLDIEVPNSLLLYGPPGCGKSKAASYIAKEIGMPLVIARLDSLISSYLGTTAKNIRNLFEFAQRTPCVLFLDEFDAIAKARDDNNELGELKRVVNSLLQNIDSLNKNSLLLCATNHEDLLDSAVWRRFDYKIYIDLPDKEARKQLIQLFLKTKELSVKEVEEFAAATKSLSGSSIEEIITKALRKSILRKENFNLQLLYSELFKFKGIIAEQEEDEKKMQVLKAKYLRMSDEKIFSYNKIGNILGVSKTTASNLINEVKEDG
ncbi:AAA family ATPase [Lysinibacillus sp. G01H]|uniref:AAA family ATPase n=1 Tax=Lysinibacillus sp. G01H TaxID=3026425 RepID=UPI00237E57C6|nr:ATP-binding protein [Lysinibacillus sp. G01H]WDU80055.1 ATP-binding protein [Lysinibacillus sp. G01H]